MNIEALKSQAAGKFYYLASPYSDPSLAVRAARAYYAMQFASALMRFGVYVYSPIHATHEANKQHKLPTDHEWWSGFNRSFIDASAGMIIANIDGWDRSRGVEWEINYCAEKGLPVYLMTIDVSGNVGIEPLGRKAAIVSAPAGFIKVPERCQKCIRAFKDNNGNHWCCDGKIMSDAYADRNAQRHA